MRNVSDKIGERKHVSRLKKCFFFSENRAFYVVTDNIIIGRREDAISCRIAKARVHTRTGNIAFPQQQFLCEHASVLCSTYIARLVSN